MNKIKVVILDAGHGGIIDNVYQTKGKRSPVWDDQPEESMVNILYEGVSTRLVREDLAKMLRSENIRYVYANEGRKDTSLGERVRFANSVAKKVGPSNCLYVSKR